MTSAGTTNRDLDDEVASAAGALNLAHAELTRAAAEALANESWSGTSPEQWLVHRAGITTSRAGVVLAVATKRVQFPRIIARFDAGELSLEQVAELVKAPPCADADIEHWGTIATPSRIRRSIKRRYGAGSAAGADEPDGDATATTSTEPAGERDWVTTSITDEHRWRLSGEFDLDSGQLIAGAFVQALSLIHI